jgi:hypothetical protein
MEPEIHDAEGTISSLTVGYWRNQERAHDAAQLLRDAADAIEARAEREKRDDGRAPFVVRNVVLDLYQGCATIYLENINSPSNQT